MTYSLTSASTRQGIDILTFSIYLALTTIGWMAIYSVGAGAEGYGDSIVSFLFDTEAGKQLIWIGISLLSFLSILFFFDSKFWSVLAYPIYLTTLLSLVGVLVFGSTINGSTSWYRVGGFTIQPSELAKFGTCLAMAAYLNTWSNKLNSFRNIAVAIAIFMMPAILILLQPDAGSAIVFFSFFLLLYREGLSPVLYVLGLFVAAMFIVSVIFGTAGPLVWIFAASFAFMAWRLKRKQRWLAVLPFALIAVFWWGWTPKEISTVEIGIMATLLFFMLGYFFLRQNTRLVTTVGMFLVLGAGIVLATNYLFNSVLKPHQQERINVWLRPEMTDPRGPRYNILQSQLAISSGSWTGRGFNEGTMTKFGHVPEQLTDFIFCTIGEEHGFIGVSAVILLFLGLLWRITAIAERQRTTFARAYAYGVAGIIFIHFMVNIGMTMGLLPVIGIPLPFLSKGGSSLLGFSLMIAVLLKLDKDRDKV